MIEKGDSNCYLFFFALPKKEPKNASPRLFADPLFSQF
jgi:hypothetical protein